jgi:arabinofuranan 3-O-arabinosyltransferase
MTVRERGVVNVNSATGSPPHTPPKPGAQRFDLSPLRERLRGAAHGRIWPIGLLLFGLALASVLANAPGRLVGDNQFALYWSPATLLHNQVSVWQADQGLGRFSLYFWPVTTGAIASLRAIGLSAWLTERVWHAALLAIGGTGMVAVLRLFRPRIATEHVVAGLAYTFGPITATFLIPSNLFIAYSLAPWLLFAFVRGVRDDRSARWPAIFALIVFAGGNVNYPSLIFAALPILPMGLYLVYVDRTINWSAVGRWVFRASVLTLLVSAAALVAIHFSSNNLNQNLSSTETPSQIAQNSSWAESWRGLGSWLVYYSDRLGTVLPELSAYFRWEVVLATFAIPCSALASLWLLRWRPRLVFAGMMVLGVVVMVGAFPVTSSTPFGHFLLDAFARSPTMLSFRNTYKAAPLLAIGIAGLVGVGAATLIRVVRGWRPSVAPIAGLAIFALVAIVAFPFWTGRLYRPGTSLKQPPSYWLASARWLNRQPGDGRVLVLPSTVDAGYRWGATTEDILDGLLTRPRIVRTQVSQFEGTTAAANLVDALDTYLESGAYQPGALAPIAQRLGIQYVLLRNDLDWQNTGRPRPASFDALRHDPDLRLVRTFGAPGQNVQGRPPPAGSITSDMERVASEASLRPVEIYELRAPVQVVHAVTAPALLVSGDGNAWPALSGAGLLDDTGPVRYTAALSSGDLLGSLRSGSGVVITDTNRRRTTVIPLRDTSGSYSYTLTAGEDLGQPAETLFGRGGSQTVAFYPDATRITASGYGGLFPPTQPEFRPSNAFDGDPSSVWRGATFAANGADQWIRVSLRRPTAVSAIGLVTAPVANHQPRILHATISFSAGKPVPVDLTSGRATVTFPVRETRYVKVQIDKTVGSGFVPPGFADITVPGVDLREFIQTPDDLFRIADHDRALAAALNRAPLSYEFTAIAPTAKHPVETHLNRRFRTAGHRAYELSGTIASPPSLPGMAGEQGPPTACTGGLVELDGHDIPVRVTAPPGPQAVPSSERFVACQVAALNPGWHTLESEPAATLASVQLTTGSFPVSHPSPPAVTASYGRDHVDVHLNAGNAAVIIGQSFDPSWHATINGRDAGPPTALDTLAGWKVTGSGQATLHADVSAQRVYAAALAITGFGLVSCVLLAMRRRRVPR